MYLHCDDAPSSAPAYPSLGSWWEDALGQVAQAGADYATQAATGVPTYGGAPAYPIQGGAYSPTPAPIVIEERGLPGYVTPLALGISALIGAKLFGLF